MGKPIKSVALVANTLETTKWVYTSVVARSLKKALVNIYNQTKMSLNWKLYSFYIKHTIIFCSKAPYSVWKKINQGFLLITGKGAFPRRLVSRRGSCLRALTKYLLLGLRVILFVYVKDLQRNLASWYWHPSWDSHPVLSLSFVTNTDTKTNPHTASLHCVGPIAEEEHPTLAGTLVRQQFEAFSTVTFEAANGVPAVVVTATIMKFTLINIWETEKDQSTL